MSDCNLWTLSKLSLFKYIWTYPNLSEPFQTFLDQFKLIWKYPDLTKYIIFQIWIYQDTKVDAWFLINWLLCVCCKSYTKMTVRATMHKCQTAIYEHWITSSFYSSFGLLLQWDDKTETNNSRKFVKVWNSNLQLLLALGMQHGSLFTLFNFHLSAMNKTKKLPSFKRLKSLFSYSKVT